MTLIATVISKYGIIQASDSNLSSEMGSIGTGQMVFHLGFMEGALALAGVSSVDGQGIGTWMPDCIAAYGEFFQPTLAGFASHLAGRLEQEMRHNERQEGGIVQIGGYATGPPGVHPEMWSVQKVEDVGPGRTWHVSEDFWARDYRKIGTRLALASGLYHHYISGTTPGHGDFSEVGQLLREFFQEAWQHETWRFRAPKTLDELAPMVELSIRAIGTLCRSSDYATADIGRDVQLEKVLAPRHAVEL